MVAIIGDNAKASVVIVAAVEAVVIVDTFELLILMISYKFINGYCGNHTFCDP